MYLPAIQAIVRYSNSAYLHYWATRHQTVTPGTFNPTEVSTTPKTFSARAVMRSGGTLRVRDDRLLSARPAVAEALRCCHDVTPSMRVSAPVTLPKPSDKPARQALHGSP